MRFECVGKIKSILPAGKLYKIILQDLETRQNWAIYADFKAIDFAQAINAQEHQFLSKITGWMRQDKGKIFLRLQRFKILDSRAI